MTAGNRHRIHRQVLELDVVSPPGAAAALQEQAARPFREPALPVLERLFDRVAGPERLVRLDRLEVDLGDLRGPSWPEQLLERLTTELRASLPAAPRTGPGDAEQAASSPRDAWFEQLVFFLAHGRLPWWGGRPAAVSTERAWVLGPDRWGRLADLLARDPARAVPRLIESVEDGFLASAAAGLAGLPAADEVLRLLSPAHPASGRSPRAWRRRFWTRVLEFVLGGAPTPDAGRHLMQRLVAERGALQEVVGEKGAALPAREPPAVRRSVELPALPSPWRDWLEASRATVPEDGSASDATMDGGHADQASPRPSPPEGNALVVRPPVGADDRPLVGAAARPHRVDGEVVFAPGAGAVLLHPFLGELFHSRGLLDGPRFRDDAARHHAVHLVGHLTFGGEAPEYDLLLAKLLCGMPWEELLPPGELDDDDRVACGDLLAAVLGHWRALKSRSADWLRDQFFLRDGTLESVDRGWRLTVERRAQDVLLTRLPWGLGVVRLPWLRDVLHVRWTD